MASYTTKELTEQLDDLRQVLTVARAYGTPDRASLAGMDSLLRQEASIESELKSAQMAEADTAVEVAIDGDPVRNHAISISFLGELLVKLQNLTNAVAQVLVNAQTARGNVPNNLIAQNRFELSSVFASSFGVGLRLPNDSQGSLFANNSTETPADVVCKLFDGQDLQQDTIDVLSSSSRVRGHYASLVGLIGKQGASVVFRTQQYPIGNKISAQQARDRSSWLELLKVTSELINVEGALIGGDIETKSFRIKLESGEIFKGSVDDKVAAEMPKFSFGARVSARLEVSTSIHEEAELDLRPTYRLLSVAPIN